MKTFPVLLSLVVAVAAGGCRQKPDTAALLREAMSLAQDGQAASLEHALANVEECIKAGVASEAVLNLYTTCLLRLDRETAAAQAAAVATEEYPESFQANYHRGKILYDQRHYGPALVFLEKAHLLKPDDGNAHLQAGLCAVRADDERAAALFEQLKVLPEFKEKPELYNEWALWYMRRGDYPGALRLLSEARKLPQVGPKVYLNLAVLYDDHLVLPRKAKREMARRNYINFLVSAQRDYPEESREVRERLRDLVSSI